MKWYVIIYMDKYDESKKPLCFIVHMWTMEMALGQYHAEVPDKDRYTIHTVSMLG